MGGKFNKDSWPNKPALPIVDKIDERIERHPNFTAQNNFIDDKSRYIVAQCSRRAGKTSGLAIRFLRALALHPNAQCVYLSLTRDSAKDIMWPVLQEMNDKYELGCKFMDSKLTMTYPNGAKLRLLGADQKNFIKRLKGIKSPAVAIDEAQDFGAHLQSLIDDVLTPVLTDYADSWLAITGTPGPVPNGYFFEITQQHKFGWSFHEWTLLDNPHLPNAEGFIEEMKKKREWDDNNPSLLREWRNKWVLDVQSLWVRYHEDKDDYKALPELNGRFKYEYIMGIDLGYRDSDAIAVLAWSEASPMTYLVKEVITPKQGITELVGQIQALQKEFSISRMIIDAGGLGKKVAEEIRRRHGIPVEDADKMKKQENVELLNDAMRRGQFLAKKESRFAKDSFLIQIDWDASTPDRVVIKKKPHSDIIDAVLYAFKCSPAYAYVEPKKEPKKGSREWQEAQPDAMFDAALAHFAEKAEQERNEYQP